ncbi:MAG: PGF-pre-PGF domain-containing protein, partial [Candidatus Methanoperedens sp.]
NYSFRIYANDSNASNASETRIVTVNRTNTTSLTSIINTTTFIVNATINITSPSGNVTVTIPNGTNATNSSGGALTNVSIDSLAQVNSTFAALSSSDSFIGENLTLGPDGARFSPDIQLNFSYTDAQLTAAGISESQLSVKFYNTSTNTWVTQTTYSQNTTGNYIIVNVSHFSTFALLGTASSGGGTTGGGSSGSTGGGGIVTSEPYTNIEKAERYDKSLIANVPVTYTYKAPELGIYEIAVTGKESENDIALRVEALKGTSKQVTVQAPGNVYKNINILAGTKRIKEAIIRFKVENSWLGSNSLAGSDVKLVKWDGSQWVQLETSEKSKDASFTFFEAKTDSFSSFAIAGLKGVTVPTATPAAGVTETPAKPTGTATPAPTPAPTEKASGFELVLVVAALFSVYLFGRKRR